MYRALAAAGALAGGALVLTGCGGGSEAKDIPVDGFYVDSKYDGSDFGGLRVVSDHNGNADSENIILMGSDDGKSFWVVRGQWVDHKKGTFSADWSHYNSSLIDTIGTASSAGINFGSVEQPMSWKPRDQGWLLEQLPSTMTKSDIGGFYTDSQMYVPGSKSFKGIRMVAADYWPDVTFLGSDDGVNLWTIKGRWEGGPGQFIVDFTPIGLDNCTGVVEPASSSIQWHSGKLKGTYWQKQSVKTNNTANSVVV